MPEQPQWSERTLDMPPQDPWADAPTHDMPPGGHHADANHTVIQPATPSDYPRTSGTASVTPPTAAWQPPAPEPPSNQPFTSGRASVGSHPRPSHGTEQFAAAHEPTGTGWPGGGMPSERRPLSWHIQELRRGGEWSSAGLLFAFVCWGIWAISTGTGFTSAVTVFIASVVVAVGVFALSRLVGRLVLERQMGRVRRGARGAHAVAGLFLIGVGIAHLQQTGWVMESYRWIIGLF